MRPVLADLCCRESEAGEGYRRAGFDVVGVDIDHFDYRPGEFVQGDAIEFLRKHGHEFDAIHASPPCQKFINRGNSARVRRQDERPDMIAPMRPLLEAAGRPWAIENVPGAAKVGAMRADVMLCGSMFPGLAVRRHRVFELGGGAVFRGLLPPCDHSKPVAGVYGHPHGKAGAWPGMLPSTLESWRAAMGMPWASARGCAEAIPPPYTELIGGVLMQAIGRPLPHQDCPACPECTGPCGTFEDAPAGELRCCACGHTWEPSAAEAEQARRADVAYDALRDGVEIEASPAPNPDQLEPGWSP